MARRIRVLSPLPKLYANGVAKMPSQGTNMININPETLLSLSSRRQPGEDDTQFVNRLLIELATPKSFAVLTSSDSNEWYTPPSIIASARKAMGGIDIDPASNYIAQRWIQAHRYFTKEDDGFNQNWIGRMWLNPPYGKRGKGNHGAGAWFEKAFNLYQNGSITQACCLGRGDSSGIKLLVKNCCFVECDRIAFVSGDGQAKNKPVPGTRIFYLGEDKADFAAEFEQYGIILNY
jgi:hypothetical protein